MSFRAAASADNRGYTEADCEVPQKLRLGNDLESKDARLGPVYLQDRLDQMIHLALGVDAARDGKRNNSCRAASPNITEPISTERTPAWRYNPRTALARGIATENVRQHGPASM